MPLITRKEAAEKMGVTIQAVYGAIKEGRLTAMTDDKGKIVINSDTLEKEWYSKSAFKSLPKEAPSGAPLQNSNKICC